MQASQKRPRGGADGWGNGSLGGTGVVISFAHATAPRTADSKMFGFSDAFIVSIPSKSVLKAGTAVTLPLSPRVQGTGGAPYNPVKHILLVYCLVILQPFARAIDISVGGTRLSIPAPAGYSPITSDMEPYARLAKRFVPPSNEQFAVFLRDQDVALAVRGGLPKAQRKFYVQTMKQFIESSVSTADFAELKQMIKTQNDENLKKAEAQLPGLIEKVNKGVLEDYNLDLNLSLAFSTIAKYSQNDEDGQPSVCEGVATLTLLHVQAKVLFLYTGAEKSGLAWSRTQCQKWADTVIAANPSMGTIAVREASPRRAGFEWKGLGVKAFAGAIIGALGFGFRKSAKTKTTPAKPAVSIGTNLH
jgi:hypothetical protein